MNNVDRRVFIKAVSAVGAAGALGGATGARAQGTKTLKFGHMLPPDQVHHKAIALFGEELGKLSKNSIKVDIFPSSQMGSIPEMLQSVQAGSLSMSMAVPAWYSSFMKPLDAFTLPYLVGNEEKLRPALEGPLGAQINKFAEPAGFKVLGYLLLGARSIVNKQRAINKPEDCKGLKLRVINSPVYLATFRALGANPVAMDPSELYLALQQGVVDGFEYPLPDLVAQRMYEVGLVNKLTRPGEQLEAALAYARRLAENAPLVLGVLREFVSQVIPKGPSELATYGRLAIAGVRRSDDAKEGIAAFKEKRKPRFRGR